MSTHQAQRLPESAPLFLSNFTRRIAREMRIAASIADDCQDALGDGEQDTVSATMAMRLQGLDLLSQQLIELGRLFDRIASAGLQGEISPLLLDDIVLSDLRRRLRGQTDGVHIVDPELW